MKDQRMSPQLASNLLFDTDEENLFDVDEICHEAAWISARVYQTIQEGAICYEVWFYEWHPKTNEEKDYFMQDFQSLEEAKLFALELTKKSNLK